MDELGYFLYLINNLHGPPTHYVDILCIIFFVSTLYNCMLSQKKMYNCMWCHGGQNRIEIETYDLCLSLSLTWAKAALCIENKKTRRTRKAQLEATASDFLRKKTSMGKKGDWEQNPRMIHVVGDSYVY